MREPPGARRNGQELPVAPLRGRGIDASVLLAASNPLHPPVSRVRRLGQRAPFKAGMVARQSPDVVSAPPCQSGYRPAGRNGWT